MAKSPIAVARAAGLAAAVVFAAVGAVFFLAPGGVLRFFNRLSAPLGFAPAPEAPSPFFVGLAAAYMFVVTVLAVKVHRRPGEPVFASLLAQAKFASATLSLILFFAEARHFILLVNGIVDGLIGLGAAWLAAAVRRRDA
jgi:hypothetical protein